MPFEPSTHRVNEGLDLSLDLFRRAKVGDAAELTPAVPRHVLVVLDGSGQDACSAALGAYLRDRFGCRLSVADAREHDAAADYAGRTAGECGGTAVPRFEGSGQKQVLESIAHTGCDLAVVPCPCGHEAAALDGDSAGTIVDVLLARSPVPLLIIRHPFPVPPYRPDGGPDAAGGTDAPPDPFRHVVMVLIAENDAARAAASWAVGLVGRGGDVGLTLLLEDEFYENVRELLRALDPNSSVSPSQMGEALEREHVRLHQSLTKTSAAKGFAYGFERHDERTEPRALFASVDHPLIVLALERGDHASEGHVRDRVRRSENPLLVVPGGRPPRA